MNDQLELFRRFDPPFESFDNRMLGEEFPDEPATVSRFWFPCGCRPGISAYLNFFLLRDFIGTHDAAFTPRFQSIRSMAESFSQSDLFIRDVTDSGQKAAGGIFSGELRGRSTRS